MSNIPAHHMANPPASAWQQNADGSSDNSRKESSVSSPSIPDTFVLKQPREGSGGLPALLRIAESNPSDHVTISFAHKGDYTFRDMNDESILARVSDRQLVMSHDSTLEDLLLVLQLADPANFDDDEPMPELWYIGKTFRTWDVRQSGGVA